MPVTSIISVKTNKTEYSKNELSNSIITVSVFVNGDDDVLEIQLRKARRSRNIIVAQDSLVIPSGSLPTTKHTIQFNLKDIVDSSTTCSLLRRGNYFILVSGNASVSTITVGDTIPGALSIVTADVSTFPDSGELRINDGSSTEEVLSYTARNVGLNTFILNTFTQFFHAPGEPVEVLTTVKASEDFRISAVTVEYLKSTFLFGLELQSSALRAPKFQPREILGVEVIEVSKNHALRFFPLNLQVSSTGEKFLSWDNGAQIRLNTDFDTFILPAGGQQSAEYIIVQVDHTLIPSLNIQELLLINEKIMDDSFIQTLLDSATDKVENSVIHTFIEPTKIVTDINPSEITIAGGGDRLVVNSDYDVIMDPVTFYPRRPGHWLDIHFPINRIISINELYGAIANTRVVHVNQEWVEFSSMNGFTQLVPFNSQAAYSFMGLLWVNALHGCVEIPNFWHYDITAGLCGELPGELRELIAREAAIPVLTAAGQAFRGGFSSQSISRDGVSESVSYTSSAIYGIYSATIEDYKNWIRDNLDSIKKKYRGIVFNVVGV